MIKEIITQWEENKHKLRHYFETTPQSEYDEYEAIVRKVFELCVPKGVAYNLHGSAIKVDALGWDLNALTAVDLGCYQGDLFFIIPLKSCYSAKDCVCVIVDYGSCSHCDTLLSISRYKSGLPDEKQVNEYMTLALHIVQNMKFLVK